MEIGLGVPRESIRLVRNGKDADAIRLVENKTGLDHTDEMNAYADVGPPRLAARNFPATC